MFNRVELEQLGDYFVPLSQRRSGGVYFCRMDSWSPEAESFVKGYYQAARQCGVVIDGRIPNPTVDNLSYFTEILGKEFLLDTEFLDRKLSQWLPRMNDDQRSAVVGGLAATFQEMRAEGKNENMLRNAYIKYMCWLYYKFERMVYLVGQENLPKVLYDGALNDYELEFLTVISRAGADVLVLDRGGAGEYRKIDPESALSQGYTVQGGEPFPPYFDMKWVRGQIQEQERRQREEEDRIRREQEQWQRIYGPAPAMVPCTNAWMNRAELKEVLKPAPARGDDPQFFYNAFLAQYGAEDKLLFSTDLFAFYQQLKADKRRLCLVEGKIPPPTTEEIAGIRRQNYSSCQELAADLVRNFQQFADGQLRSLMIKAFVDQVRELDQALCGNIKRLTNRAVYLLTWLKRYYKELFAGWKGSEVGVFLLFGGCTSESEAVFLRLLSRLPVDVVVIHPNLSVGSSLQDPGLLELRYEDSVVLDAFPTEQGRVRTAAYQAERDLDEMMYRDSGAYRSRQHSKAEPVVLQAMYEEIFLLWDQELKYRPSFAVVNDTVSAPVLLEKISGVKDGDKDQYWLDIKRLLTPDAVLVRNGQWPDRPEENPVRPHVTQFLRAGRLQRSVIKGHKSYQYSILRPEIQEYLLDKLQLLLDRKLIAGTYRNGTEFTILATVLDLDKSLLRLIQKFDFTKKNPKLVFVHTTEEPLSLESSILAAYLSLVGFDVVFFVPTGYQCVEKYFPDGYLSEQQAGDYLYDLTIPNFDRIQDSKLHNFIRRIGRRN